MANNPKNTEYGIPGQTITLDVTFRLYTNGPAVDPDSIPTYTILDPEETVLTTGSGNKVSTGYYTATYEIPVTAVISKRYKIIWEASVNGVLVEDNWEYFQVISPETIIEDILISNTYLNQIKSVLAYPSSSNILLTDSQIKDLCIAPAMREYFTRFPLKQFEEYSFSEQLILDFPDSSTFGVLDLRVVEKGLLASTGTSFWDVIRYQLTGINLSGGTYNQRYYNPNGLNYQKLTQLQQMQSLNNAFMNFNFNVDYENKKVYIYGNSSGKVNITWAKYGNDFDNQVKYNFKNDVIKLAQAKLLYHLADTASIVSDSNLELSINADALKARASELETKILEKWEQYPKVLVLRMT